MALLEADVALPVIKSSSTRSRRKALGAEVRGSLTPGQVFISILHRELVALMGGRAAGFSLRAQPPIVVLLAGLQGAGKTTTAAKLARWLIERERKRVLLVEHRCPPSGRHAAAGAARRAGRRAVLRAPRGTAAARYRRRRPWMQARRGVFDVLIVDTAGRLHVDEAMMEEVRDRSMPRWRQRAAVRRRCHGAARMR